MKQKAIRTNEKTIAILGGGCAGWSLAAKAEQLSAKSVTLYLKEEMRPSHSWGFWQMPWLSDAVSSKRAKWNSWQIITEEGTVNHNSIKHAYHNLKSDDWFNWCRNQFLQANTKTKIIKSPVTNTDRNHIITSKHKKTFDCIYDSRSPKAEKNILFQHFKGIEIKTTNPVFNPEVATLMDFRVSQKNGIHFMYVLGYDAFMKIFGKTSPDSPAGRLASAFTELHTGLQDTAELPAGALDLGGIQNHVGAVQGRYGTGRHLRAKDMRALALHSGHEEAMGNNAGNFKLRTTELFICFCRL